jgi:hypothetical protein
MEITNIKYNHALERTLSELSRTLSYRNGYNELLRVGHPTGNGFFEYALLSMHDSIFFHAIKILDKHHDVTSFWYLYDCDEAILNKYLSKYNLTLDQIDSLSEKLKQIRDKTAVNNPSDIWKLADITRNFFDEVMDKLWNVLTDLYLERIHVETFESIYDGHDIEEIIKASSDNGIII